SGNLIVNGDFEAGRTGFTSGLIYSPGNLLDVGKYDVVKNPFLDSQYATSYGDHTSGSGFMLAANGATDANTVVWQQTVSVVPNSTYQFSIWASSWYSLNPARLDFLFNDSSIGTFSPPVTAGSWSRFTATWNSGSSTTLTLKIIDRNADF